VGAPALPWRGRSLREPAGGLDRRHLRTRADVRRSAVPASLAYSLKIVQFASSSVTTSAAVRPPGPMRSRAVRRGEAEPALRGVSCSDETPRSASLRRGSPDRSPGRPAVFSSWKLPCVRRALGPNSSSRPRRVSAAGPVDPDERASGARARTPRHARPAHGRVAEPPPRSAPGAPGSGDQYGGLPVHGLALDPALARARKSPR